MFKSKSSRAEKAAKQQQSVNRQDYFENCHRTYSCIHCRAHLANHDELISKLFQGNHGRAYLFNKVVNIGCKQAVERELLTGLHAVADIYCDSCETTLGWKYEQAFEPSQKYKEGKYIIELVHMLKENSWDLTSYNAEDFLREETGNEISSTANGSKSIGYSKHLLGYRARHILGCLETRASDNININTNNNNNNNNNININDNIDRNRRRHASSGNNNYQTTSRSTSLSMIKDSVNNNPCKRDDNKRRVSLNENHNHSLPSTQAITTDSCHEPTDSRGITISGSSDPPPQSSSIVTPHYTREHNNAAQVELVNGIELIERSLDNLSIHSLVLHNYSH